MCDIIALEQIALKTKITVGRIDLWIKRCLTELTSLQKRKRNGEIRTQFNATLDNVSVEEKDGTVKPFKEAYKKPYDKN